MNTKPTANPYAECISKMSAEDRDITKFLMQSVEVWGYDIGDTFGEERVAGITGRLEEAGLISGKAEVRWGWHKTTVFRATSSGLKFFLLHEGSKAAVPAKQGYYASRLWRGYTSSQYAFTCALMADLAECLCSAKKTSSLSHINKLGPLTGSHLTEGIIFLLSEFCLENGLNFSRHLSSGQIESFLKTSRWTYKGFPLTAQEMQFAQKMSQFLLQSEACDEALIRNIFFAFTDFPISGLRNMPAGFLDLAAQSASMIKGMYSLSHKDPREANKAFLPFLKVSQFHYSEHVDPVFFTLAGLSLFFEKNKAANEKKLRWLAESKAVESEGQKRFGALRNIARASLRANLGPELDEIISVPESVNPHMKEVLDTWKVMLGWKDASTLSDSEESRKALSELIPFFRAERKVVTGEMSVEEFEKTFEMKPPLWPFPGSPAWSEALDALLAVTKADSLQRKPGNSYRIIYIFDQESSRIYAARQASKNGGKTWGQYKIVYLDKLTQRTEGADKFDIEFAEMVSADMLGTIPALLKLAPTGRLFTEKNKELIPLEIIRTSLEFDVETLKDGSFKVTSNMDGDFVRKGRWFEDTDGTQYRAVFRSDRIEIYDLKKDEDRLHFFLTHQIFPPQAREKLVRILQAVSKTTGVFTDLLEGAGGTEASAAESVIAVQIRPLHGDREFSVKVGVRPSADCPLIWAPGEGRSRVSFRKEDKNCFYKRDLKAEKANFEALSAALEPLSGWKDSEEGWTLGIEQCLELLGLLRPLIDKEKARIEWPEGKELFVNKGHIDFSAVSLNIGGGIQRWFNLDGNVSIDGQTQLKMNDLLRSLAESEGRFVRLGEKEYVAISEKLRRQLEAIQKVSHSKKGGGIEVSAFNAGVIEQLQSQGVDIKGDGSYEKLIAKIDEAQKLAPRVPKALNAELRAYQKEGFSWMVRLAHWGAGAVLADDMGLGKTLQTIATLLYRKESGPSLIVVPTAVLYNWVSELERFAPSLRIGNYNQGSTEARQEILNELKNFDVVLATYGVLNSEIENLSKIDWNLLVLDEAQAIKNKNTQAWRNARAIKSHARILLSGTPIQNHLSELWSLFEVANPGLLGNASSFTEEFAGPIERDQNKVRQALLKQIISPFILRRVKTDVIEELPQKTEISVRVELSEEELALYESMRTSALENLASGEINHIQALAELTKLRQAACAPALVNPNIRLESSKTAAFLDLVDDFLENNHRALVFSQFTSHLNLIKAALDEKGIPYLYLDGATSAARRKALVKEFQEGDVPLFLISLKAGGVGLNLTGADYVIHMDPWWNPAVEDQASDRAYRIGQQRNVTIYRLIAKNTIEERIIELHKTKKNLADALLEGTDVAKALSREELLELLS